MAQSTNPSFTASKPITTPAKRQSGFNSVVNGFNGNDGAFNFIDGFNNFNQQQQVIQIQNQNLQIVDNGRQQAVVQQVEQVLIVDQVNNGFNNDLNNLFRKSNFQNQFRDVATVTLVVQEIQVAIDDGRGNQVQQNIFAQSAVVANRGARETQTVMVFDSRTLIAQDILGIAGATGALDKALPTKTAGIQLFGAKPTWTAVAEDPAATLGAIWQGALQDLQDAQNDEADNKLNEQIAAEELKALEEALGQQEKDKDGQDEEKKQDEEEKKKAEEEEAKKKEEEQKKAEEEAAKKDAEEQKQADEAKKQEAEQEKKAEEEAAKKEAEDAKKAEEEAAKQDAEKQKKADEEQKKADEEAKAQAEADKKAEEEAKKAEETKAAEEKKAEA
jgi:hypothetical protein